MKRVLAIILGGGAGTRLYPLTKMRAKPAVPLAGKYRLIDIPISNCINSDIHKMYVMTQFNSASLNRHLSQTLIFPILLAGVLLKSLLLNKLPTVLLGSKEQPMLFENISGFFRNGMLMST